MIYTFHACVINECKSGLEEGKGLQERQSTRFQKYFSEPTIFPKVRAASYFDIDIDILLDDVLVCTRITTEEAMITDIINVQQMLYIFLYSFSRSENLEFLTQWYWVV